MKMCFNCGKKTVFPQDTLIHSKALNEEILVEALVCQDCGFTCFTDRQADLYDAAVTAMLVQNTEKQKRNIV